MYTRILVITDVFVMVNVLSNVKYNVVTHTYLVCCKQNVNLLQVLAANWLVTWTTKYLMCGNQEKGLVKKLSWL